MQCACDAYSISLDRSSCHRTSLNRSVTEEDGFMNVSRTNNPWPLSILVALSAATCAVVDHPVGTEAKEEPVSGFVPMDEADSWSNEIVRECAGGIPELPE